MPLYAVPAGRTEEGIGAVERVPQRSEAEFSRPARKL
jgi:hypothetical protein